MTELRSYYTPPNAPLTAGARFIRGFRRVGVVVAALVFLAGLAITLTIAIEQQSSAQKRFEQASCIAGLVREKRPLKMRTYDQTKIDYEESGCAGYYFYGDSLEIVLRAAKAGPPAMLENAVQPFFIGLAVTLISAALSFSGFWLIGWLCAGFTRD
ncbi:hypothetical protein [Bradyrhizobium yuanmingense]|uniref:hypothetical protein n=1 Tax=Bradyrhizobium yuanmingense TaxID=108015 RepID=UPI001CD39B4D|nr:hypothetical protein [Bradyrhizobium yuanmingense]MCA1527363.1 hypothetical protein [Bradyrhizobium yuanmingense]